MAGLHKRVTQDSAVYRLLESLRRSNGRHSVTHDLGTLPQQTISLVSMIKKSKYQYGFYPQRLRSYEYF